MKSSTWVAGVCLAVVCVAGCTGSDGKAVDPRCVSICAIHEPEVAGAFDICSTASAEQCKQECTARVADVKTLCASCLLEQACFAPDCGDSGGGDSPCDPSGQCTVTGRAGSCTYPAGNQAARADCLRQVEPRRTVECTSEYRPQAECNAACATSMLPDAGM